MIKLSKLADYALLVLHQLGTHAGERLTAKQLAALTDLPLPTVRKVLALLLPAAVVDSSIGVQGGYALAQPLSEITLLAVLHAVDGDWALTACQEVQGGCRHDQHCSLRHSWQVVNAWLMQMLGQITVAEMAEGLVQHRLHALLGDVSSQSFLVEESV